MQFEKEGKTQLRDYLPPELRAERLKLMQELAEARGGRCLATEYVHCNVRMEFMCAVHGRFEAQPRHIAAGTWCRQCRDDARKPPVKARLIAYVAERGGKLKSEYINARTHVTIECPIHGDWKVTPDNLLNKFSWCQRCARGKPRTGRRKKSVSMPILL